MSGGLCKERSEIAVSVTRRFAEPSRPPLDALRASVDCFPFVVVRASTAIRHKFVLSSYINELTWEIRGFFG